MTKKNKENGEQKGPGRPPIYDEPRRRLSVSVPDSIARCVIRHAQQHGITTSAAAAEILAAGLIEIDLGGRPTTPTRTEGGRRLAAHALETGQDIVDVIEAAVDEYLDRRDA